MPTVSVLLPVYNALPTLPRALEPLLNQTLKDFEIIAVDDGSTDGSGNMLDQYAQRDKRLRVVHQPNAGALGKVLNRAAGRAQGKYLARQDADDASALDRLERQVDYLDSHPEVGVCGTWNWHIDPELGPLFSSELPDNPAVLNQFLQKGMNPFIHGSVMMRASLFQQSGGYRGSLVEDFDLWLRMSESARLGITEKVGYYYWHSAGGISAGAHMRQSQLVKLSLLLHKERVLSGREITSWEDEYQRIQNMAVAESDPIERQTSIHYARSIHLMRVGKWQAARNELAVASRGQGQYARKARRNLVFFSLAPLVGFAYHLMENREKQQFARNLPEGTTLPTFLNQTVLEAASQSLNR